MITDSINQARGMGAPDGDVLDQIYQQNPNLQHSIDAAKTAGADPQTIINEIMNQNAPQETSYNDAPHPLGDNLLGNSISGLAKSGFGIAKGVADLFDKTSRIPGDLWHGKSLGDSWSAPTYADKLQSSVEKAKNLAPGSLLNSSNTTEQVAKTAGDVAGFFAPGGAEEKVAQYGDKAINALNLGGKVLPGILQTGVKALTTGVSTAGVNAIEGGDTSQNISAGVLGSLAGVASKVIGLAAPVLFKNIAESSFKLTPTMAAKAATKVENAASFVGDNKLSMNPATQYKQLSGITSAFEDSLQASLPSTTGVAPENLINELTKIPETFSSDKAIYQQVKQEVDQAIKTVQELHETHISLDDLLAGKRSYGTAAFGKSSAVVKIPGVISEGDYAIEQAYQNTLDTAMKHSNNPIHLDTSVQQYFGGKSSVSLGDFNKVYSQAISAKQFSNLAQFKNDTHLVGRLFGLWAGEAVGGAIMPGLGSKIIGGATGEILSNKIPTIMRQGGAQILKQGNKIIPATKIGIGAFNK